MNVLEALKLAIPYVPHGPFCPVTAYYRDNAIPQKEDEEAFEAAVPPCTCIVSKMKAAVAEAESDRS